MREGAGCGKSFFPQPAKCASRKPIMALLKIVVLDGHALNPGDLSWDALRAIGELQVFDRTADDQIVARAHDAQIVLTTKTRLPAQVLAQLNKTRYIGVLFTGYERRGRKGGARPQHRGHQYTDLRHDIGRGIHFCAAAGTVPSRGPLQRGDSRRRVVAIHGLSPFGRRPWSTWRARQSD